MTTDARSPDSRAADRPSAVDAPGAPKAGPYSHAVRALDLLFTSGQVGLDPDTQALVPGGFEAEVRQAFRNLDTVLKAAGLEFGNVVKSNIFLTDVGNFAPFNAIYGEYFQEPFPARTTIGVAALPLQAQVEIEMIALSPPRLTGADEDI